MFARLVSPAYVLCPRVLCIPAHARVPDRVGPQQWALAYTVVFCLRWQHGGYRLLGEFNHLN